MVNYRRVAEITTWVGLFLLLPGAALGYFAEGSLPGQPLYPMKRGIEQLALVSQSFNADAKALYEVELTNRRLAESTKLLASKGSAYNFDDVYLQIESARASISTISDSTERKIAEQKLIDTISLYQEQLTSIESTTATTDSESNVILDTPTPPPSKMITDTNSHTFTATPTPTPAESQSNQSDNTSQQIDQLNTQLEQIKDQITDTSPSSQGLTTPTSTPAQSTTNPSTPTPTPVPHVPVFTYPINGQSLSKGEKVSIAVNVLNGNRNDKLTIYVDGSKLCTGSYPLTCYWIVPNHYSTGASNFTIMAQVVDVYGRYTSKSIVVYLKSGSENSNHHD